MKKKRVTIEDVAQAAGVSLMTVSRAINGRHGIGEETRARILDLVHRMNYQPSQIARSLATRQTNTLGLVVPDVSNPFFAHIARGAEDAAFEIGFSIFLINSAENVDRERFALDSLWQKEVNGVILCSSRLPQDELLPNFDRFSPMVLVNRELKDPQSNVFTINVDDHVGAELVVRHFLENGRKQLAIIAGPETSLSGQRRRNGFQAGLQSSGLAFDPSRVVYCTPTLQGGMEATLGLLDLHPDVDAIFAYNDLVAVGALQACKQRSKSVPAQIAVVGADDVPLASLVQPMLSTLQVNLSEIGRMAVSFFHEKTHQNSELIHTIIIQPELIIRESG